MARPRTCWLVKSEPDCFSIDDLAASPGGTTCWSGVRNYQARNFMRDGMKRGDEVLYYHSSTEPPAIVGRAVVAREAHPDHTAWDENDDHFDPKASSENPIWQMVDIRFVEKFSKPLPLDELRPVAALKGMELLKRGSRLSVQPVSAKEFDAILKLAHAAAGKAKPRPAKKGSASKSPVVPANVRREFEQSLEKETRTWVEATVKAMRECEKAARKSPARRTKTS